MKVVAFAALTVLMLMTALPASLGPTWTLDDGVIPREGRGVPFLNCVSGVRVTPGHHKIN
jgi:hypothetical protein